MDEPTLYLKGCPHIFLGKSAVSVIGYCIIRGTGGAGAAAPPALCSRGQRGQLCPFLITIELFYHANNFVSDVRNVINESELIVAGRHWSVIGKFICAIVKYNKTNYSTSWLSIRQRDNDMFDSSGCDYTFITFEKKGKDKVEK